MNRVAPPAWERVDVQAAGTRIATFVAGNRAADARTLLLLHGLGHWSEGAWGRLVPELDPALRCLAFDLPGFGASARPEAAYDLDFFRAVVDGVAAAAGLQRFALAGHSLGGLIAADYAGAFAERVTRLALIAPAGFARTPRHLAYALAMTGGIARPLFARRPSRAFVDRMMLRSVDDPDALDANHLDEAYRLSQDPSVRRAFGSVYAGAFSAFARARLLHAQFARFSGPVFCAWGATDRFITPAALREVVRVYPRARTLLLERTGHLAMVERAPELGAALRDFLH
ncbi:lipase [Vulcanimicrobium alpinum]|uniref:Lipase n=1 Tax=Vulcanimicrobium alpinum TaxID=3016050 RepID=A0AAN1XWR9_UNVUL|nr:alpha/beta fold hydrolase [Vulcanimicrobium alpinum]BDE05753.1 lipase [Vulcanimicrobium alpinum]